MHLQNNSKRSKLTLNLKSPFSTSTMSHNVPMLFRDWWSDINDWDWDSRPFRTSRLLDQHFGTGLRKNDLLSSLQSSFGNTSISPTIVPRTNSPYYRPWGAALQRQDSGSTINLEKDKYQIILDVQQFTPDEVTVKTVDKFIVVEGKHEEKQDEHGYVSRHFVRKYLLPAGHDANDVVSTLSSDGILTVIAPKKALPAPNQERAVPISHVGPSRIEQKLENPQSPSPKIENVN